MPNWANSIDEKKVFADLFDIYEQELLTIFQYVAPINLNNNLETTGNKIHELHLRVCAECENLVKQISKKLFPERNFDREYQNEKSEDIKEILDNVPQKYHKEIKKNFYRHADMPFYLGILNEKLWICDKKIEFCKIIEAEPESQVLFMQPFDKNNETWIIPLRREHYNKIKHDKIDNYNMCTLRDLVNSLWAYYMLLNYFSMNINNPVYDDIEIKSKIFKPTIWRIKYPQEVRNYFSLFREDKPSSFFKAVYYNGREIIPWYYDDQLMNELKPQIDEANNQYDLSDIISEENNQYLKKENFFFYNSLEQHNVAKYSKNKELEESLRTLKLVKKFNILR